MNPSLLEFFNFLLLALNFFYISDAAECDGCIILGSKTFDRVLNKFDLMLVKFDKYNPDKKKHAIFEQVYNDLSKEVGMENMIAAHVDISSKGEVKNADLVDRYGLHNEILENNLPAIFYLMKPKEGDAKAEGGGATYTPLRFKDTEDLFDEDNSHKKVSIFDADAIKRSIRTMTGIYFTLPGCLDDFDFLAIKFAGEFTNFKRRTIIAEAEAKFKLIPETETDKRAIAQEYINWMRLALEDGEFPGGKILRELNTPGSLTKEQEQKKRQTLNILDAFTLAGLFQMVEAPEHDEL